MEQKHLPMEVKDNGGEAPPKGTPLWGETPSNEVTTSVRWNTSKWRWDYPDGVETSPDGGKTTPPNGGKKLLMEVKQYFLMEEKSS